MAAITFTSSPSINQTRTSNGITWTWTGTKWRSGGASSSPVANGAITYSFGTDTVHAFTSSGTLTLNSTVTARILVVAGGGGGNSDSGGGGGGGVLYYTDVSMTAGTYTVTVGTGGLRGEKNLYDGSANILASNGNNSSIIGGSISYTAIGGGHGGGIGPGGSYYAGGNGGSGGGGYRNNDGSHEGTGTSGQGYNAQEAAGGGAWNIGQNDGGPGIINDIAGFPMSFGGGGAGVFTNYSIGAVQATYGYPGLGGGGGMATGKWVYNYPPGYTIPSKSTITNIRNSWSYGGGGGSGNGGDLGFAGFQGIVIVRYAT